MNNYKFNTENVHYKVLETLDLIKQVANDYKLLTSYVFILNICWANIGI